MNPYEIPSLESDPRASLKPFKYHEHEEYYVKVDNSVAAYEEFQERIGNVSSLLDEGRIVVALGLDGCGKTSLLNRCATWIHDGLAEQELKGRILSLTDDTGLVEGWEARARRVFQFTVDDLVRFELLDQNTGESLEKHSNDLDRGYRALSDALAEDQVLIVILPPSELPDEVAAYAQRARKKIIFLIESSLVDHFDRRWSAIASVGRTSPILLKVGLLEADHGWLFTLDRQEKKQAEPPYPKVSKETIEKVMKGPKLSIGRLQEILYLVYYEIRLHPPQENDPPLTEITYEYITHVLFQFTMASKETRFYLR